MHTPSILAAIVLAALPQGTLECATNGLCGYSSCGGYQAAPVAPSCSSNSYSCRPSYSCGSYGCYRARARSSKTLEVRRFPSRGAALESDREILRERLVGERAHDVVDEHLERLSETAASLRRGREGRRVDPNRAFHECCLDRKLPDACLAKCHYGAFTKDALTRMYFKQDGCPLEAMAELQFCAAQGRDHKACCARNGVSTTLAGEKCLLFCDQTPGRVTKLDLTYTPCFDRFESMKACFWHDITSFYRA